MKKLSIKLLLEIAYVTLCVTSVSIYIGSTILRSEPDDFNVFYSSATTALNGGMIYDTYGPYNLPYWYFPWLAWFYIPFAFLSREIAYAIYLSISIVSVLMSIYFLATKMAVRTNLLDHILMCCTATIMCWLLFLVGQMDFILLAIVTLMIHLIDANKPFQAGLFIPILLFKPHLFIIFIPYAILKGGKLFFASASTSTLILIVISFIVIPDWPMQMLHFLAESGQRTDHVWNFITLPTLLGSQENWSGTANIPFTFALILLGLLAVWNIRNLQTFPVLSMALAASLFCAPRAYTYNLPILIPAMIWLSSNLPKPLFLLFWSAVGILPFLFHFSTGTYSIVLTVFLLGIFKGIKKLRETTPLLNAP